MLTPTYFHFKTPAKIGVEFYILQAEYIYANKNNSNFSLRSGIVPKPGTTTENFRATIQADGRRLYVGRARIWHMSWP